MTHKAENIYCMTFYRRSFPTFVIDQWNWIESPEIDLHLDGQLIFNRDAKVIQWERG